MDIEKLIGMTYDDANALAESYGFKLRVKSRDGNPLMVTQDIRHDRVNVSLVNNIVKSVKIG